MPALHVRNVDDSVLQSLKERAARNHRSLEGELRSILERAAREEAAASPIRIKTVTVHTNARFDRAEIYGTRER